MTTFIWDLGFDFNAVFTVVNNNNTNTNQSYLQNGFVVIDDTGNVPTTPVGIQLGDSILFNVFNTTSGAQATSDYSITGGSIQFQNAEAAQQSTPSPFVASPAITVGSNLATITIGPLGSTNATGPSVIFGPASPDLGQFPVWGNILKGGLVVANNGRFLMTVSLTVQGPPEPQGQQPNLRTFVVDPEMVIGSDG